MIRLHDVHALSDFQRNAKHFMRRLEKSGRPAVLTVNGQAKMVVQDAASYQKLLDAIEWEDVAAVRQGVADLAAGRSRPFKDFAAEMRKKYGISSRKSKTRRRKAARS